MEKMNRGAAAAIDLDNRLSLDDTFQFACGPQVPCFTECCGKLELSLTPYDVLRLRRRLGMTSEQFLDTHTIIRRSTPHGFPEVMMQMDPATGKRCPFVKPDGCSVYEDRPGACRIYPLGRAATRHPVDDTPREFYFTVREEHCRGFEENRTFTVREWIEDQGIGEYNKFNDLLMDLYVMKSRRKAISLGPSHMQMFIMACYNTARFRDFIFKSPFLKKFQVDPDLVQTLKQDDVKLLEFAFQWLRFALFQEPTLTIRQDAAAGRKEGE